MLYILTMVKITTHVLDVTNGIAAKGISVELWHDSNQVGNGVTNSDGRCLDLSQVNPGIYELRFRTKEYFDSLRMESFFPFCSVAFEVKDQQHYHVPLLLSAFSYTTYRGT